MNIYLVGFMGVGKTSVAKILSRRLNYEFVEMDEIIEQKENRSITEIFAEDGEKYFRIIEKKVIDDLSKRKNLVVSCGGGVVLDEDNIKKLKRSGIIVCLMCNADTVYERVKDQTHRPLLNVENPKERIRELLDYRKPFYEKADYEVDTSNLTIQEVADKTVEILKKTE